MLNQSFGGFVMNKMSLGRVMPSLTKAVLSAVVLGCAVCAPVSAAAQPVHPRIVVFGGSLSDAGNLFALQKQNNVPPSYDLDTTAYDVPNSAYARGGHHLSNGPTWAEQFAKARGWAPDAAPAFASADPRAGNYAVAGARARSDSATWNVPMATQVGAFLQRSGGSAPADALYVIDFGGNDIRDALFVAREGGDPSPVLGTALQSIGSNMSALYAAGARRFLVLNVPNISFIPSIAIYGQPAVKGALNLTVGFNLELESILKQFDALPGINIQRFNLFEATNDVHDNAASYGLTNVDDPCITPDVAPFFCQKPDEYFFWDGLHPTRAVHAILAQKAAASTH
jgi:phospholipase/lecithinase/hemolysin